jgi:ParB family chromosome partitioning protein
MLLSLEELATSSERLLEGEVIVSLDPGLVDSSPVADRAQIDDKDYRDLVAAIQAEGQSTPVLVRPHPETPGRYMIVFGRRRLKAASDLQIPVRAVVKPLDDAAAVVAQGQENSARADLSFIERALFAQRIIGLGHPKDIAKAALTVDDTLLSRLLSVVEIIPETVVTALSPAKGVGRDRWEELKKLVLAPKQRRLAAEIVESAGFEDLAPEQRFNFVLKQLQKRPAKKPAEASNWASPDKDVAVKIGTKGKAINIAVSARHGKPAFGIWITENLEDLYRAFRKSQKLGD